MADDLFVNGFGSSGGGGIAIQGAQGVQGVQGLQGLQGVDGSIKGQGVQGVQGEIGLQGVQGVQAVQGIRSSEGAQGIIGIQGLQGLQGTQALEGFQGFQGIIGLQGVQGVQAVQGVQGTFSPTGSFYGYYYKNTPTSSAQSTSNGILMDGYVPTSYVPYQGQYSASNATLIMLTSVGSTIGTYNKIIAEFENVGGTDATIILSTISYISQNPVSSITIKAGERKQIVFNTSVNFTESKSFTNFWRSNDSANIRLNRAIFVYERLSGSPVLGTRGLQGVQGVQGLQGSAQQLAFDAQKGVGTAIQALNFDGVQYTFSAQQGNFNNGLYFGIQTIQGITPLQPYYRVNGYFSIRNYGASAMDAMIFWTSRDNSSGGTGIIMGGSRIPADGRVYVIPFTFLWRNESDTNQDVHFYIQGEIVGTSTAYYDFEYVGAQGTASFNVVGNQVSGTQGLQGTIQGTQGLQGIIGGGLQGVQGLQGVESSQGAQGVQGVQGTIASQGIQGLQGLQGVQGLQGFSNYPTDSPITLRAYNSVVQLINAGTIINLQYNTTSGSDYFVATSSSVTFLKSGWYKICLVVTIENTQVTPANVKVWIEKQTISGSGNIVGTTSQIEVAPSQYDNLILEDIILVERGERLIFECETDVQVNSFAFGSASNYPSGGGNQLNIEMVARGVDPTSSATLTWTTGYFNLTNLTDNQLPMNLPSPNYGNLDILISSSGTNNASLQFVRTGVYMIDTFSHLFDMGSGMRLTTSLYTSTDGTTWTFLTFCAREQYTGTNTNQIQVGKYLLRVTAVPFYIQMRLNPTANSPFPADLGAPTYIEATRIGDI